jgi:integrase
VRALALVPRVLGPDEKPSPWLFPVTDDRKTERRVDRKGRRQSILGDRRSPDTTFFGKKLRAVLAEIGITRTLTIHGLRRTFAVLLQESGAPDSIIDELLGHGPRTLLKRNYLPRRNPLLQEWVNRIQVDPVATSQPPNSHHFRRSDSMT